MIHAYYVWFIFVHGKKPKRKEVPIMKCNKDDIEMTDEDLIAIIIPVYNAEQYLEECIQSILQQTYSKLDVVIVDDGSTDNSYNLCLQLAKRDIRIKVLHKENGGPLSAKKMGIENTLAKYIMFVDADDWIKPEMCEALYKRITLENVDLVTSGIIRYFADYKCIYDTDNIASGKYCADEYKKVIIPHMLCNGVFPRRGIDASLAIKIFKKELLYPVVQRADEQYGYLFAEDTAVLYPYMLSAKSIYIMHECFYYHRQYPDHSNKYYEDEDYQYKLNKLYTYMSDIFKTSDDRIILMKQLDYFICGLFMAKYELQASKIVKDFPKLQQYLFPFNKVKSNSRLLLYGAGNVGKSFYAQLIKAEYCKEIIWQDEAYEKYQKENLPVTSVDMKVDADICVIAVENKKTAMDIKRKIAGLGMAEDKIIWDNPLLSMW